MAKGTEKISDRGRLCGALNDLLMGHKILRAYIEQLPEGSPSLKMLELIRVQFLAPGVDEMSQALGIEVDLD